MRSILYAAAFVGSTGAAGVNTAESGPVRLDVQASGDGVELVVTGDAAAHADARFQLEVESAGAGGSTRTVQAGINRRGGGVLLRSRIQTSGLRRWTARLKVTVNGREYSETRSSDD